MPKVIETLVYQFDELSDKAKEKARDWYREASEGDNYFAESIIEDANELATRMGIELGQRAFQTVGGKTRYEPAVSWSGFWSQGDGASFEGKLTSLETGTALERVKDHAPVDETLHAIASRIDALQAKYSNRLAATISLSGHRYCHSNMMQIDAVAIDAEGDETEIARDDEQELTSALRAFADWIYRQLEEEYNYQNSDEQIDETIRANEYEFKADGRRDCL
jgi:hypothetical protein